MSKDRLTQTKHYQECIAACFACAQTCETCSDDMIGMDHHGVIRNSWHNAFGCAASVRISACWQAVG
jgi:hypothetical protein